MAKSDANFAVQRRELLRMQTHLRREVNRNLSVAVRAVGGAQHLANFQLALGAIVDLQRRLADASERDRLLTVAADYLVDAPVHESAAPEIIVRLPETESGLAMMLTRRGLHNSGRGMHSVIELRGSVDVAEFSEMIAKAGGIVIDLSMPAMQIDQSESVEIVADEEAPLTSSIPTGVQPETDCYGLSLAADAPSGEGTLIQDTCQHATVATEAADRREDDVDYLPVSGHALRLVAALQSGQLSPALPHRAFHHQSDPAGQNHGPGP